MVIVDDFRTDRISLSLHSTYLIAPLACVSHVHLIFILSYNASWFIIYTHRSTYAMIFVSLSFYSTFPWHEVRSHFVPEKEFGMDRPGSARPGLFVYSDTHSGSGCPTRVFLACYWPRPLRSPCLSLININLYAASAAFCWLGPGYDTHESMT